MAPDAVPSADRLWASLRVGLGRWIGVGGYRALLARALDEARDSHPVLSGLACQGDDAADLRAAAQAQAHGALAASAGMVAVLTGMIELLGRITGEEMALHLVEQFSVARTRIGARRPSKAVDNG